MGGSGAEMHSYVTLYALLHATLFLFFPSPSLYLSMHWDFVDHLLREKKPLRKQDPVFRGPISKIHSYGDQLKCKAQIKPDH